MDLCLGHPRHGYYITRQPFGAAGDFVTAPDISQMFGELIGLWAAEVWRLMGAPARLRLVELGPGRGTLLADAMRAARLVPAFRAALDLHLVETSPVLRLSQRQALAGLGLPLAWHDRLDTVPDGPAIIIANEFLDCLPVRQYVRTPRGWCERLVGLDAVEPPRLRPRRRARPGHPPCGRRRQRQLEVGAAGLALAAALARRLAGQGGAALVIDYGHLRSGFGWTLQAVKGHAPVDPLAWPGAADLTAHVDFAALAQAGLAHAAVHGPLTQGEFLLSLGIGARADALRRRADGATRATIDAALARLTGSQEGSMGSLFKAIALAQADLPLLPGFDRRRLPAGAAWREPAMIIEADALKQLPGIAHAFFTRQGGVSDGIFASLNGGVGSSDDGAAVAENRRRMAAHFALPPHRLSASTRSTPPMSSWPRRRGRPGGRAPTASSRRCPAWRSAFPAPIAGRCCSPMPPPAWSAPPMPAGAARFAESSRPPSPPWSA